MKRFFSLLLVCMFMLSLLYSCGFTEDDATDNADVRKEQWVKAQNTPFGKYPETVTYTLGKQTSTNNSNMPTEQWAAYVSRISACRLISQDNVEEVKTYFFSDTPTMDTGWWRLKELENNAYLRIVTGQADISYFDTFVEEWGKQGGLTITREVNESLKRNED